MRIAQLAPLYEPVPPVRYGGSERVVAWLCSELVRRGHEVTLFASGDSRADGRLVPVVDRALRLGQPSLVDPIAWHLLAVEMVTERLDDFDLVHSHLDYLPFQAFRGRSVPFVTTLHGRLDIDGLPELFRHHREPALVSISRAQRGPLPDANWIANVYHGLPVHEYTPGPGDGEYFLFLGRICPEKRTHVAIQVAREAGVRLVIAAKVDAVDRRYFEETVEPLLHHPQIDFIGEVDELRKAELLRHAKGLLFPILWPEPFGLAMIESMAHGTPVITRRCGSTPEVIEDGKVGYLCNDDDELVRAIKRVDHLDRATCRRWVEDRFSSARMVREYEAVYETLLGQECRAAQGTAGVHRLLPDHDLDVALAPDDLDTHVVRVSP